MYEALLIYKYIFHERNDWKFGSREFPRKFGSRDKRDIPLTAFRLFGCLRVTIAIEECASRCNSTLPERNSGRRKNA